MTICVLVSKILKYFDIHILYLLCSRHYVLYPINNQEVIGFWFLQVWVFKFMRNKMLWYALLTVIIVHIVVKALIGPERKISHNR